MTATRPAADTGEATAPPSAPSSPASAAARLDALCAAGAARLDPVTVRSLRALAVRIPSHSEPVQQLLLQKFDHALEALARRVRDEPRSADPAPRRLATRPAREATLLGQLTEELRASAGRPIATATPATPVRDELPSVERFRRAWAAVRAQAQVAQGAARIPANAGPLNSHALVLQTLSLMQDLSPAYLAHFLRHVESLQWLEQAAAARTSAKAAPSVKPARRSTPKKK
jgi:hypothetical protein